MPDAYVGIHNATAFGLLCPQQKSTLPIPDGFSQVTIDYLKLTGTGGLGGSGSILDGEDCKEAIIETPYNHGEHY